jgi:hypothetical protein
MLKNLGELTLFYFLTIVFLKFYVPFNDILSLWIVREASDINNVPFFTKLFKLMTSQGQIPTHTARSHCWLDNYQILKHKEPN